LSTATPSPLTLHPLEPAEDNLLCGRENDVAAILEYLAAGRFTVLLSPPGFGASSLLRAGVQPALLRAGAIVAVASDWDGGAFAEGLRETVAAAVHDQARIPFATKDREPLIELLARAGAATAQPIAILLDQFEEYLRCHAGTDISDAFDAELSHAISSRAAQFVVAMHPSAVDEFERFGQFIPNLLGHTIALAPLSHEAAAELLRRRGIESAVANEIVSAPVAAVKGGVNPSLIAIAAQCRSQGSGDRRILTSLDPVLSELRASERRLLSRWIPRLVTEDGHRIAVSMNGLRERASARGAGVESALAALIRIGLLRHVTTRFGVRYLLTRDALGPILRDWGERTRRKRTIQRQTFLRGISVLVGLIALYAAYRVYYGAK
jgi:hypothetical protein